MDKLWVDKYRPKKLEQLDYNLGISVILTKLAKAEDFPHLLFYGCSGAGKKTRIMAFLNQIYGSGVFKMKTELKEFKVNKTSSTTCECNVISSNYHLDITPSDAEHHDKVVIQKLIKEIANTHQLDSKAQKNFKCIVISEADRLTKEAQAGLRRTMEKYVKQCRLIFCCENIGRIIQPLRSRCLLIRVSAPESKESLAILQQIADFEQIQLPQGLAEKIVDQSDGNLRQAILTLQTCRMQNQSLKDNIKLHVPEWKYAIKNIAKDIITQQTPEQDKFYDLLINCIPGEIIMKYLLYELIALVSQETQIQFIYWASYHENKMQLGQKQIFHLEAFVARAMQVYRIQSQAEKQQASMMN